MIAANSLDVEGKAPFHLKIAFQYYDLDGKAAETGTVEEWWVSSTQFRTVVTTPSMTEVFPAAESQTPEAKTREGYLIHELLNAAVHPFPRYTTFDGLDVRAGKQREEGATMSCVLVENENARLPYLSVPTFCVEPKSLALRLRANEYASTVARNSMGVFHDANVSLDLQISYGLRTHEQMAITGHVTSLGTFDPSKSTLALGAPLADRFDQDGIPEVFVKGKVLYQRPAKYPLFQGATGKGALVSLRGLVTKDGSVTALVVMSSPDPAFSQAAIDAVSDWKYRPYRVGETPVEVYSKFFIDFVSPDQDHIPGKPR